ncbi:hypothetical protein C8Q76DRAFT_861645, partial [Earliella scabrosa]
MPTNAQLEGMGPGLTPQLRDHWSDTIAPQMIAALAALNVHWSCLDIVCMEYTEEHRDDRPVTIRLGVKPGSLSREDGAVAAGKCLEVLKEHEAGDVEVAILEVVMWPDL